MKRELLRVLSQRPMTLGELRTIAAMPATTYPLTEAQCDPAPL